MSHHILYFVETKANEQRRLLCRWVERFYEEKKRVQIMADSTMAAQHLDQLLWTYSPGSFIPHRIAGPSEGGSTMVEPVVISIGERVLAGYEALICDGPASLDFLLSFSVSVHFIIQDDHDRLLESRLMWKAAREQGIQPNHVPYSPLRDESF
ncbi:MAG: DNA polymerase III subunit chi [Acidobacteriota bacterium]